MPQYKRICRDCNQTFFSTYSRSLQCLPCWKKDQDYTLSKADEALIIMQEKYTQLEASAPSVDRPMDEPVHQYLDEIKRLKERVRVLMTDKMLLEHRLSALKAMYDAERSSSSTSGTGLTRAFIKKLLMLCHPDKHDNSDLATEVTKELLSKR